MKRCPDCEQELELSEFAKNRTKYDGKQSVCRACGKIRAATPQAKATRKRSNARWDQSERGKEMTAAKARRSRKRHPERERANWAVHKAVKEGRLPRPETVTCYRRYDGCRITAEHWHHHSGYDKAHHLAVLSICKPCHTKEHEEARV